MITINLLKRPDKKKGTAFNLKLPFQFGRSGKGPATDPQVKARIIQLAVVAAFCTIIYYFWTDYEAAQIATIDAQIEKTQQEFSAVQKQLAGSKQLEELQQQLQADEVTLKAKLDTLNKLLAERDSSFKAVKAFSLLMPREIWIKNFTVRDDALKFGGGAIDYNNVSDFIKTLQESATFGEIKPVYQRQDTLEVAGGSYVAFELEVKRK